METLKESADVQGELESARRSSGRPISLVYFRGCGASEKSPRGNERRIRYELEFSGDDGARYRIVGQKDFFLLSPVKSITNLPFSLYRDDFHELGDGEVSLDPREELVPSLKSVRLGWSALLRR